MTDEIQDFAEGLERLNGSLALPAMTPWDSNTSSCEASLLLGIAVILIGIITLAIKTERANGKAPDAAGACAGAMGAVLISLTAILTAGSGQGMDFLRPPNVSRAIDAVLEMIWHEPAPEIAHVACRIFEAPSQKRNEPRDARRLAPARCRSLSD